MQSLTKIVGEVYKKYFLDFDGQIVAVPYRINIPFQSDRRKYGKSNPDELKKNTLEIAQEESFNINQATSDEIRDFMIKNMLGIDCSGLVYNCLEYVLEKLGKPSMEKIGYPKVSSTNATKLASTESTITIEKASDIKPGDMILLKRGSDEAIAHIILVEKVNPQEIIYIQSTCVSEPNGVQKKAIKIIKPDEGLEQQNWQEVLINGKKRSDYFNPDIGDSVRRLKILNL